MRLKPQKKKEKSIILCMLGQCYCINKCYLRIKKILYCNESLFEAF